MPNWKRVILSGSNAHLNEITASGDISGSALSTLQGFGSITASQFGDKASNYTGSFSGDGSSLVDVSVSSINITAENTQNAEHFLTFTNSATGQNNLLSDTSFTYNPSTNVLTTTASKATYIRHFAENADNDFNIPFLGTDTLADSTEISNKLMKVGATGKTIKYNPSSETLKVKNLEGTASVSTYVTHTGEDANNDFNIALLGTDSLADGESISRKSMKVGAGTYPLRYNPRLEKLIVSNLEGTASNASYVRHFGEDADNDYNIPFLGTDSVADGIEVQRRTMKVGASTHPLRYNPNDQTLKVKNLEGTASLSTYAKVFAENANTYHNVILSGTSTGADGAELGRSVFKVGATGKTIQYNPSLERLKVSNLEGTASLSTYAKVFAEDGNTYHNVILSGTSTGTDGDELSRSVFKVGATGKTIQYNPTQETLKVKNLEGTASISSYGRVFGENANTYHNVILSGTSTAADGVELGRSVFKVGATGKTIQYNPSQETLKVKNLEGTASRARYVRHFGEDADNDYNVPFLGTDSVADGVEVLPQRTMKVGATGNGLLYNPNSRTLTATTFAGNATTATTATGVDVTENNSNDETVYITFVDGQTGTQGLETDSDLTYNPSTNTISAGFAESASFASRITTTEESASSSGSFSSRTTTLETTMVSEQTNIDNLQTDSGSFSTRITQATSSIAGLKTDSGSFSTRITDVTSSINAISTSFSSKVTTLETTMVAEQTNIDNLESKVGQSLNTSDSPTFAGLTVQGKLTAEVYAVSSSVTHMTRSFSSGSTIFGDDSDDTHQLTGSLLVTGSFLVREGDISGSRISASNIVGTNLISDSSSLSSRTQTLETTMVSEQTNIDNLQTDSGSFSTRIALATSSIASATASIANLVTRIGTEETNVDNLQTDSGSFSTRIALATSSIASATSSIASLVTTLTSEQSNIDDLEAKVGQSLNTSDSPLFAGLTIDGNISASGDVIAQNYIVRSTVTTITSSFSSGSTIFGDDQQDTHKFTGSLLVTGSLNIVGDGIISGSKISASNIVGTNLISDSGSFSTRITDATASINAISTSMSSRLASAEGGAITGIDTDAGVGLSGGTTSGTATLSVNFGDTTLQTAISGAFTQPSSSISTRITTIQGTGTIQGLGTTNRVLFSEITSSGNVSGSGTATASFGRFEGDGKGLTNVAASSIAYTNITGAPSQSLSLRVTQATASIAAATASINSISSSFSTRVTGINSGSISTRLTTESTNIDSLQTDSGSFSTRVTQATSSISAITSSIDSLVSKVGQSLNTSDSPTFAGLTIDGDLLAQRYIVSSSVTHITSSFSSGSTIFGDTIDDTHKFTGSLFVSGSNNKITGSLSVSGSVIGKTLILGGGTFTSASLASGGGGVFADIDGSNSRASRNLQVTGSMNISSSLTVKPTNSGSTAINTTNINAGFPTANRWQDNLEGSYFNNFDHNTNVSEILRFMAGIISHSIDTASPTKNTKTYGSVTPSYTDGTHSSKDTILNGVLGSSYEDGRLSKAWTGSAYIDMSETGSYKLALNYLEHKGWVQSSERGTASDDVGTNPFHGSYASRIPSNITTQGTYATLTHTLSATAGGSSTVYSNSNHFGLGGLTSGGATEFKVRVMATQSFSDNYADTTPDQNSTFTRNAVSTLTQDSFGTTSGVTLAKINSANPAVIPAAFQDGIFSSVAGALSGRQNHGGSTTSTNISASGYYAIHGVKAGIATGSGNFSFQDGTSSTTRFYLYTGGITTDITDGAPTGTALGVTGSFIKTKNSCVSRSFSGAPYVASLQVNYTIAAEGTKSFDPVYNANSNARTPFRVYLYNEAAPSPMSTTLSTATVLVDSNGVDTAVTSGLKRGVFDRTKTTQRSDGDIPNISDICIVSASYSQSIAAGGNVTDITKIVGNLSEQRYARTFGYQGRNWQGNNRTVTDPSNAQRYVLNTGTFGQPASSGSLAVYTRAQGGDPTTISSTTEAFLGEDHRRRISNGLLANTQNLFTTALYATVDRKSAIDTQHGSTTEVPCMPGSYDLQVKPGYLVDPGSDFRYWFPSGYNSSQTYKYYIRTFQTDGGTKSSMTVRLRNESDAGGGTTLQNWNSTGAGYACAILFESSTTAGNNTSFSTARLYDVADQSNNVIEAGVSADNFKNPFTDDIDLYGSKDGSTSSGTYTVPLRNADGMYLDANDNQLHLIIRHKAASSSNPQPLTSIIVSFS